MQARLVRPCLLAFAAAAALTGCGPSKPDDGGGGGGGSGFPQPGLPGVPIGEPTIEPVDPTGGVLASPDGHLFVEVPPGAVPAGAQFTVQELTNLAPGGIGPAWRLGPEGTTFPVPITLTFFAGAVGRPLDELTVAWQDDEGYWHRAVAQAVVRDPTANTLTVRTNHLSSWTLTTTPTARDFKGAFSIGSSLNGPVVAQGDATFTFAGEDADATYFLLSGTLVLPSTLGTTTCTPIAPDTDTFPLRTNVAELSTSIPSRFDWGASGAWHVSCADGTTRLVTVAFDTVGVGFTGCARVVTRGEVAGLDAALGGVSWDCTARGQGQTSGSWDYTSAVCGTACFPANPCKTGTVTCGTGAAICTESGNVLDGASCGTDQVCSAGACVGCTAGTACTPANPCVEGTTSCATGTSTCVESTTPATPLADGATCGTDQVCSAGSCVACAAGVACTPSNPCHQGLTSCTTGTSVCEDTGFALADGATCGGPDLFCYAGACIVCAQDAPCTSTNTCTATATYECSSGTAVCTDRASQPPGTACGPGLVCSAAGACDACTQGASCSTANPCAPAGTVDCAAGSPVCVEGAALPAGTSCGTGLVCNALAQCLPCSEGATCTPLNSCLTGTTTCASGTPVCVETTTPVPSGTSCGTNQVCNAGICTACSQGALCASDEPCASTATVACATGTPVCTPQAWLPAGAACGALPDFYCNATHACGSCTPGASCTPANTCAASGSVNCTTGEPVCVSGPLLPAGTVCVAGSVCSAAGVCTPCTPLATCTSTNPCAATATTECANGPVCTDRTFVADGTPCGTDLACSAGSCIPSRTVTASRTVTYWPDAGAMAPVPPPAVSASTVSALVPADGGTWGSFPGSVDAAGAVTIPNVPTGTFWLRFQGPADISPTYLDTAGGAPIDLGYDQLGRSTVTLPSASTPASLPLALATAWPTSNAHQVQLVSSNADVWVRLPPPSSLAGNRRSGTWTDNWYTTATTGTPLDLLLSGDSVTIFHLVNGTVATRTYLAARSKGDRTNFAMTSGTAFNPTQTTLATTGLSNRTPATGTWNLVAFEALRPAMNLPATGVGPSHTLVVGASVGTLTGNGPVPRNGPPTLFSLSIPVGATASSNVSLGTALTYARVLDITRWNEWRQVSFAGSLSYVAPGASAGFTQSVSVGRREAAPATSALAPTLSPVRNLRIRLASGSELSATVALTGFGTTPLLLWDVPATGTPTSYVVEVFRLGVNGTLSTSTQVATFLTGSTQVAVPTGVLTAGSPHYARVTARAIASDPWAAAPFRRVVLGAWAETLSGILTP